MVRKFIALFFVVVFSTSSISAQSVQRSPEGSNKSNSDSFTSGWRICNKSGYEPVWVAYSFFADEQWVTRGWRELDDGDCTVIQDKITNSTAYYHASTSGDEYWGSNIEFCAHPTKKFEYFGDLKDCPSGHEYFKFDKVDLKDKTVHTQNLTSG